jgi:alpha-tubulin suppressor-like RCC1 family protein
VAGSRKYTMVTTGQTHTCAIATNGGVYCWGSNSSGQTGQPTGGPDAVVYSSEPMRVGTATGYTWVSAGFTNTCAVRAPNGYVFCWGDNASGQNGNSSESGPTPRRIAGSRSFRTVAVANSHACGLETGGLITCWGTGFWGQLGTGDSISVNAMGRVAGNRTYTTLSEGGAFHTCAAAGDGAVYCWGANFFAQAGRDPTTGVPCFGTPCAMRPSRVTGTTEFAAVAPE